MNIFVLLAHTMWYKYSRVSLSLNCRHEDTVVFLLHGRSAGRPGRPWSTRMSWQEQGCESAPFSLCSGQMAGAGSVLGCSWHSSWSCAEQCVCSVGDIPIQPHSNLIGFMIYIMYILLFIAMIHSLWCPL